MGHHEAETIRQAADLLSKRHPAPAVLAVAVTPLVEAREVADWLNRTATHTAGLPYCCQRGTIGCPYAGPALRQARRIIAAAQNNPTASGSSGSGTVADASGETNSSSEPSGA
jgi:hypothetical protein